LVNAPLRKFLDASGLEYTVNCLFSSGEYSSELLKICTRRDGAESAALLAPILCEF